MNFLSRKLLFGLFALNASHLLGDTAFVTDYNNKIYSFDTDNLNTPATAYAMPPLPDNITFSPDGSTVYFTTSYHGDVYSFAISDPSVVTKLNTGIPNPMGIAISSDGTLGFSAQDNGAGSPAIYSFPITGATHTATLLTPIGTTIPQPLFIVISDDYAFVGDIIDGTVYSVIFTPKTYDATLVQSFGLGGSVGGLAISSDGYLYISNAFTNQISRVPLTDPTATPTVVANPSSFIDGLAVSNDGKTVFFTHIFDANGIYSFPTNRGFPATISTLSNLSIFQGIDIAIQPLLPELPELPDLPAPPTNLTGSQYKHDFGLAFERVNLLKWKPSASNEVAGYYVYRNGSRIATLDESIFSYEDHNIKKGVTTLYSVSAFDSTGNESPLTNIEIN